MSEKNNGVDMDDAMTLARVQRWLGKFADMPDDKVGFPVKCCDFLMGIIAFQREQLDRMRAVDDIYQNAAKEAAHAGRELRRIAAEPVVSYRTRIAIVHPVKKPP